MAKICECWNSDTKSTQKNSTESISSNEWVIDQIVKKVLELVSIEKIEKEGKTTASAVHIDCDVKLPSDTDAEVIMDDTLMLLSNDFQRLAN